MGAEQKAGAPSCVPSWGWQRGGVAAPNWVSKRAASLDSKLIVLQALSRMHPLFHTVLYGTNVFSWFIATNSRGESSLHDGIFCKRFCMLELGEMAPPICLSWCLAALTSTRTLQWDHPPFPHGVAFSNSPLACTYPQPKFYQRLQYFAQPQWCLEAARSPLTPSSVRRDAWCHHHCRSTRDFRECWGEQRSVNHQQVFLNKLTVRLARASTSLWRLWAEVVSEGMVNAASPFISCWC